MQECKPKIETDEKVDNGIPSSVSPSADGQRRGYLTVYPFRSIAYGKNLRTGSRSGKGGKRR